MPAIVSRTFSFGRPRMPASCCWSTCNHWVAMCRSTPPSPSGIASPDSGPRGAWSCMPISYSPVTTTSARADWSPWRIFTWRSRLPSGCRFGAPGASACSALTMGCRDERHRLAPVADVIGREDWLVFDLEPVHILAPQVMVREHCPHAGHGASLGDVDVDDPRVRVRAAHRRAPQHPLGPQFRRVGEGAAHLGAPVWAADALADPHLAAICTASMIVP